MYHRINLFLGLLLGTISSGCIKDDLSDCPSGNYRLVVQTDARDQVGSNDIADIVLFLFDANNRFVDYKTVALNEVVELHYPNYRRLKAVAWANTGRGDQTISSAEKSLTLDDGRVRLLDLAENGFSSSPDDLFHGIKDLDLRANTQNDPDVLVVRRKVAAITIVARHLKEYAESFPEAAPGEIYSYEVKVGRNSIDFFGNPAGEDRKYRPSASFNPENEFVALPFYVFPSESGKYVEVVIYKGMTPLYTIRTDPSGQPLQAEAGKLLELVVDFAGDAFVTVSFKEWSDVRVTEEF